MTFLSQFLKNRTTAFLLGLFLVVPLTACDASATDDDPERTIVEVASEAGNFNTLVAALEAAGLVGTLQGDGPFTVFAPTDAAFAKLPEGTVESLLRPENRDQLISVLTYHVVAGKVTAAEVVNLDTAPTVQGATLNISVVNNTVRINDATVTTADIEASNGVIHVIDTVLLPPSE